MVERVLITGVSGFIGRHLAEYLLEQGVHVFGLDRARATQPSDWRGERFVADMTDIAQVLSVVREVKPDYVFHLAALIKTESLRDLLTVNVLGTQNLLDSLVSVGSKSRIMVTGTSAEYGLATIEELPIREENPQRPLGAYGISKVAQSLLAAQYAYRYDLGIIRTRTFNLTGPGEPETLVCSAFAKQIVEIENGLRPALLEVGNLDTGRDFLDVRDAIRAYWLIAQQGEVGQVYNVCSGSTVLIRQMLDTLIDLAGIQVQVHQIHGLHTRGDVPNQTGDPTRLRELTHWSPTIVFRQSLKDLLDDWRKRLAAD